MYFINNGDLVGLTRSLSNGDVTIRLKTGSVPCRSYVATTTLELWSHRRS
jgi:hypothetical protein